MLVNRKVNMNVKIENIKVGDPIEVQLKGLGSFTATAQKIAENEITFLFDECITMKRMNEGPDYCSSFESSDLYKWLQETVLPAFPENIKARISYLAIPTYGMIFGHDEWYNNTLEPDDDEQFELMKTREDRVFNYEGYSYWYWLRNATNDTTYAPGFALVIHNGHAGWNLATISYGVLPVFVYKK